MSAIFSLLYVIGKGGLVAFLMYKFSVYSKLEFYFPVTLVFYLFKKYPYQFLSNCELAEPVFCSEELSCLPYKNQKKSMTLSFCDGKFKFAVF